MTLSKERLQRKRKRKRLNCHERWRWGTKQGQYRGNVATHLYFPRNAMGRPYLSVNVTLISPASISSPWINQGSYSRNHPPQSMQEIPPWLLPQLTCQASYPTIGWHPSTHPTPHLSVLSAAFVLHHSTEKDFSKAVWSGFPVWELICSLKPVGVGG